MKKTIFIYFSYSGDNKIFADIIKRELECDLLRLEPVKEYTNSNIKILFQGGYESVAKKLPTLKPYEFNANDYEYIIIATPVWASTFAPVLRSFFQDNPITNKKIILTCSHRGGPGNTIKNLTDVFSNNQVIYTTEIKAPIVDDDNTKKIVGDIISRINSGL